MTRDEALARLEALGDEKLRALWTATMRWPPVPAGASPPSG